MLSTNNVTHHRIRDRINLAICIVYQQRNKPRGESYVHMCGYLTPGMLNRWYELRCGPLTRWFLQPSHPCHKLLFKMILLRTSTLQWPCQSRSCFSKWGLHWWLIISSRSLHSPTIFGVVCVFIPHTTHTIRVDLHILETEVPFKICFAKNINKSKVHSWQGLTWRIMLLKSTILRVLLQSELT